VRREGAGRKALIDKDPDLLLELGDLVLWSGACKGTLLERKVRVDVDLRGRHILVT
jgi:hypothetical protein